MSALEKLKHQFSPKYILDIGANCGHWAKEAQSTWPESSIFLVEGNEACEPYILATGFCYAICYLGDSEREVAVFKRKGGGTDTGNSYLREKTQFFADDQIEVEQTKLMPLSELFSGFDFDFIKIDVQGAELDVIRGGLEIVKKADYVLMEVAVEEYNEGAPAWDEVHAFMASIGFNHARPIEDIVHPIGRQVIQRDVLFSKQLSS